VGLKLEKQYIFGREVKNLLRKLITGYFRYFSMDKLNSDGRKLFEEAARMLVYEHPEYKPLVTKARRDPTLDNVMKIAKLVLGEEANHLLITAIQGPYDYISGLKIEK